ncbi:MAG: SAM-dependent methyltransferase [uncultured Caballeronia sp.]|nr:MAG: SAM-dependent methyltransferase [uncultured Caballeronia sp.]
MRGRPDYPPEIADWLRDQLGLRAGTTIVDLGAGTGKFTPRLISTGAKVIAAEPVAAMLGKLSAALPQVETHAGTADSIPLPDASVDAVVCAQSFHWFSTHAALAEILRVLKPGGKLGLIWNLRDASVPWVVRLDVIVNRVRSTSFVAALSADEREKIDNEVHALIASEPLLAGKDVVTVPYETAGFYVEKLAR